MIDGEYDHGNPDGQRCVKEGDEVKQERTEQLGHVLEVTCQLCHGI